MGLDIYAGTLTRCYAQSWKSATQQWAEANGYSYSRITPEGQGGGAVSAAEVQEPF